MNRFWIFYRKEMDKRSGIPQSFRQWNYYTYEIINKFMMNPMTKSKQTLNTMNTMNKFAAIPWRG